MKKNDLCQYLYHLAYLLISISWYFSKVNYVGDFIKIIKMFAIIIFFFICIIQDSKYHKKSILILFIYTMLGIITWYISESDIILVMFLMFFSIKNINMKRLIKYDMIIKILFIIILFILYNLNMTNEHILFRDGIARYSFGFSHPNIFGFVVASIWIDYIYLYRKKISIITIIGIIISFKFIDYYADSRSSGILIILILIASIINKEKLKKILDNKFLKFIICNSWLIFSIVTFIISYLYYKNTELGFKLNDLFTNRLMHNVNFFQKYGFKLFGNNLIIISSEKAAELKIHTEILDNLYAHFIIRYGILVFVIFYHRFKEFFKNMYKSKNYLLIILMFLFLAYSIMETRINNFVFILYLGKYLFSEDTNEEVLK